VVGVEEVYSGWPTIRHYGSLGPPKTSAERAAALLVKIPLDIVISCGRPTLHFRSQKLR
jgi:hypothetical protein